MNENLINLLNKLSIQIVSQETNNCRNNKTLFAKNEKHFKRCVHRLTKKGYDVLLKKTCVEPPEDPCVTEYGGNWSPFILLSDYETELQSKRAGRYSEILHNSLEVIQEKEYDCITELLKFLLLLKRPIGESSSENQVMCKFPNETVFSGSDFLLNMLDSFSHVTIDYPTDVLYPATSNKKALQYKESWTKNFDGSFELLGEYSKKNLSLENGSLNSLFIRNSSINKMPSQASTFVLADFFSTRNEKQKSLMELCNNSDENGLLDKLVGTPINHKLPDMNFQSWYSIKSGFLEKLNEEPKEKKTSLQRQKSHCVNSSEVCSVVSEKSSVIELKRNSNCCHSFSILYEKSRNSQELNYISDVNSCESSHKALGSSSKDIIIGLWEEQHELLREFRPELECCIPKLRMIPVMDYIEDVKYLFTGINNETFNLDSSGKSFHMVYGTCLQDVTPESLFNFSKSFLDIGNSYVKLTAKVMKIGKNNFDVCKTVSQAFWKSIFDFLELHYTLVLEIPSTINLMALKFSTMDMREMIVTVAEICKVSEPPDALPEGGQLLTYLLQIAEKLSKTCVRSLVFGIIQNCCNVYFIYILQTWMFQGVVECDSKEFFVNYKRPKTKTKSRCYYNSFSINNEEVPSFLKGYEENIFNCGKSIHFLKLFNTEDKFCQLLEKTDYPTMYPCFNEQDLDKLKSEFEDFEKRAMEVCGDPVSVKIIREEDKKKEEKYLEFVKECKRKEFDRRETERRLEEEKLRMKKLEQTKRLNQCWKEIKEEKRKKMEALKMEKMRDELNRQLQSEETQEIVQEGMAVIRNYYDEKVDALEKKLSSIKARKRHLKHILTSIESDPAEILDNVIQLDVENNITGPSVVTNADQQERVAEKTEINPESITRNIENASNTQESDDVKEKCETDVENNVVEVDTNANPDPPKEINENSKTDLENNIVEASYCSSTEISSNKPSSAEGKNSADSIFYDVNSNPSLTNGTEAISGMRKFASYHAAKEEAKRNKFKVLRSEFDLQTKSELKKPTTTKATRTGKLTDIEKNRLKVLRSEYDMLPASETNDGSTENILKKFSSPINARDILFETINLGRKPECVNFKNLPSSEGMTVCTVSSRSLDLHEEANENVGLVQTPAQSSLILNEIYQKALARDAEIFQSNIVRENIFCSLGNEAVTKLPCKDFIQFQRYLKKSVLIPLKIQEKLANDALLKQLLLKENLLSHLNSLRGYFFLNDGEFGRSFTQRTFRSLAKCTEPGQFFERSNLSNIVNEALNYTIHNDEPNAQNLSFQIVRMPPFLNHASHDVLSPFELSYKVDWPLNIILTEKALLKYKMVFQFLLKLKRINWTLNENYLHLNSYFKTKKLDGKLFKSSHYHKIQIYRHAMSQVMITLDDYIFSNGIQLPWLCFQKDLETTENIDHLYQKHVRYMKDVLMRCFLSKDSEDLLNCLNNLIEIALKFHYTTKSSNFELIEGKLSHPKYKILKLTFAEFCTVIKTFLRILKEKISANLVSKSHYVLIEKFDQKLT